MLFNCSISANNVSIKGYTITFNTKENISKVEGSKKHPAIATWISNGQLKTIEANTITAFVSPKGLSKGNGFSKNIKSIHAIGDVVLKLYDKTSKTNVLQTLHVDRCDSTGQLITCKGRLKMRSGGHQIEGDEGIFDIKTDTLSVNGVQKKRATAQFNFHPN